MASVEFKDWLTQQYGADFPIYFISGEDHWKKEFINQLKKTYKSEGYIIEKGLDKELKDIRYKSLRSNKKILMYEPLTNITITDIKYIKEYIKRGCSKHGIFILSIKNWREKKLIRSCFRFLDKSKVIKFFDLDFPSVKFKDDYINHKINEYGVKFDCKATKQFFIRRVSPNTEEVVDSIVTLKNIGKEVDKNMVKEYTEDHSTYNYDRLFETVTLLNRVRVPYIAYQDLLDSGRKSSTIIINLKKHVELLYQAKYLNIKGILRENDTLQRKKIYDKGDIQFNTPNIWDESKYRINKLIEQSRKVSMQEVLYMLCILREAVIEDDEGRVKYIDDTKAYKVFLKLLGRREVSN